MLFAKSAVATRVPRPAARAVAQSRRQPVCWTSFLRPTNGRRVARLPVAAHRRPRPALLPAAKSRQMICRPNRRDAALAEQLAHTVLHACTARRGIASSQTTLRPSALQCCSRRANCSFCSQHTRACRSLRQLPTATARSTPMRPRRRARRTSTRPACWSRRSTRATYRRSRAGGDLGDGIGPRLTSRRRAFCVRHVF